MISIKMAEIDAWLFSLYKDSDNNAIVITNESIRKEDADETAIDLLLSKIAYLENGCTYKGSAASSTGCLKAGWLTAAHQLAKSSNSKVTIMVSCVYTDSLREHRVEIVRGSAKVVPVSEIADVVEKWHEAKLSLSCVAELLSSIDKLIYTIQLY